MSKSIFKKCNRCPYYFGEIDQCMVGEDNIPKDMEKKCKTEGTHNDQVGCRTVLSKLLPF